MSCNFNIYLEIWERLQVNELRHTIVVLIIIIYKLYLNNNYNFQLIS